MFFAQLDAIVWMRRLQRIEQQLEVIQNMAQMLQ